MNFEKKVSVIIPSFNEEEFIESTIELVQNQDYPNQLIEIIVVDGQSTDRTPEILNQLTKNCSNLTVLNNPQKTVPFAFNLAIPKSKGEIIVILGAHSEIPSNYISILVKSLIEHKADNVGGVMETVPPDSTSLSKAIALACSSKIGMGNSQFRVGANKVMEVDTVPFGCYKKEIFDRIGLFDTELTRNQDDELNARITKIGGKILLIPAVKLKYYSRNSLRKLWRMFYQYGLYKPVVGKKIGRPSTVRQLVPPLFLLSIISLTIATYFWHSIGWLLIFELLLYEMGLFLSGLKMQRKNGSIAVQFKFIIAVHVIHFAYGIGYLQGVWKFLVLKKRTSSNIKSSR